MTKTTYTVEQKLDTETITKALAAMTPEQKQLIGADEQKGGPLMAKYTVTYYIKSGGREHECDMQVEADNAAEACKLVKDIVKEETGRNAFRAKAKKISNS